MKKTSYFFVIICIFISFSLGIWLGRSQISCQTCQPEDINFSLFWDVWNLIEERFTLRENMDVQKMIYGAISGMVESLDDPYTIFMLPEETKLFREEAAGQFEGIGMEIDIKDGQLQVVAPLEGTPAKKAGLKPGDIILQIGDKLTYEMSTDEAISLIRGPKGSEVRLTIFRNEWSEPKEIKLIRSVIKVPSLKWELKEGNIAYIRIYQFMSDGDIEFADTANAILNSPADRIIIDLRDNPGGYLDVAQDIAGWFLERGQIIAIQDFGEGQEQILSKSEGNASFASYPVVILINKGSASGSEILAGALRDNKGIQLIGETSFGKGLVQQVEDLPDGSSVKITIAKWLTPKGESIHGTGLKPNIEVPFDENSETDNQLDKAIEIVKDLK